MRLIVFDPKKNVFNVANLICSQTATAAHLPISWLPVVEYWIVTNEAPRECWAKTLAPTDMTLDHMTEAHDWLVCFEEVENLQRETGKCISWLCEETLENNYPSCTRDIVDALIVDGMYAIFVPLI